MTFLVEFISRVPIWVWPLFLLLFWIGWRASKPRRAPQILFYMPVFLVFLTINEVRSAQLSEIAWVTFGLSYFVGIASGFILQKRWLLGKDGRYVLLAGEWFTMLAIMLLFWINFLQGFVRATSPTLAVNEIFVVITLFLTSWASGTFLGRVAWMIRAR